MGKIVAVANQKGGVGKTTTAVNLAHCVAETGRRVLLIDLDPQGNATSGLGGRPQDAPTSYDVLSGEVSAKDAAYTTPFDGLMLIPSGLDLAGAEIEMSDMEHREQILRSAVSPLKDEYDDIFIDCPPSLGLLTVNALTCADSLISPIQCEYYALEGVGQLMNTMLLVRRRMNPDLQVEGVVLTMYDARLRLSEQVAQEVRSHFHHQVYDTVIPRNVRLSEAPSHGMPVAAYDSRCPGAAAYRALAAEYIRRNKK